MPVGSGNEAARTALEIVQPEQLISRPLKRREMGQSLLAGVWLWHDFLHESHTISQNLEFAEGSFWHAIMHRREGDFSNSKYWYRRVGEHPAYATIAVKSADLINPAPADKSTFRIIVNGWNADAFVDLVQQVHNHPDDPRHGLAIALQQIEWRTLFDHCARQAAG